MPWNDTAESKYHRQQLQHDDEIHKADWRQTAAFQRARLSPFWRGAAAIKFALDILLSIAHIFRSILQNIEKAGSK